MYQHDGFTGEQLNFMDIHLAEAQNTLHQSNHCASTRSQAHTNKSAQNAHVKDGDLIYFRCDGDKHVAREKYITTASDDKWLYAKKLIGSQFRAKTYKLKHSEVYPVPTKCASPPPRSY